MSPRRCCNVAVQEHHLRTSPPNARSSKHVFHASNACFTPPTSHFTPALQTPHFISCHVSSSHPFSPHPTDPHLIPSLLACHVSKSSHLFSSPPSTGSTFLISWTFSSQMHLRCCARQEKFQLSEKVSCAKKLSVESFANRIFSRRCIYAEKPFQHVLYHQACKKHIPALLCPTKLAQSTSQYYFVLQSLQSTTNPTLY